VLYDHVSLLVGNLCIKCYFQNKVTEKFKRPFKKRHSSVYHQPSNRVNKYLAQAIDARSVDREKSTHVSLATLCFKDREKENQVGSSFSFPTCAATTSQPVLVVTEVFL
jgi:adenylate cyclase 1